MNFISICSGIEAASAAFTAIGWKAIAFSEIDKFASAVLQHHYPNVKNFGDMTKFRDWPEDVFVNADAVVGGPPCQAFSVAGTRQGLNDERGNLTLIYVELLNHADAIRSKHGKPPVVALYENVPGIFSDKTNAFGCLVGGLAGEDAPAIPPGARWTNAGCVFGAQRAIAWRVLDAQFFGVAQRRRRVFVVASARPGFDPAQVLFEWDGMRRDSAPSRETGEEAAGTLASRAGAGGFPGTDEACSGYLQPVTATLDASYGRLQGASGQDSNHGHSTLVVHGTQDPDNLRDMAHTLGRNQGQENAVCVPHVDIMPTLRSGGDSKASHGAMSGDSKDEYLVPVAFDTTQMTSAANRSNPQPGDPCRPLAAGAHAPAIVYNTGERYGRLDGGAPQSPNDLPARPVRSLQRAGCRGASQERGLEGSQAGEPAAPVQKLPHEGSPVREEMHAVRQPAQGAGLLRYALPAIQEVGRSDGGQGQPVHAGAQGLRSEPAEGVPSAGLHSEAPCSGVLQQARPTGAPGDAETAADDKLRVVHGAMAVRRLLPVECERLQGFPDGYTAIPWRGKPADQCPDGPRYKALGNSWAVPVARWIGRRIHTQLLKLEATRG